MSDYDLAVDYDEVVDGRSFEGLDLGCEDLSSRTFYSCTFKSCNFSETDLSGAVFEGCTFTNCNLSNCRINGLKLTDVDFLNCKISGWKWRECSQFCLTFLCRSCLITGCDFSDLLINGMILEDCDIHYCYFQETRLVKISFKNSRFKETLFHKADLREENFCGAEGYVISPLVNNLKKTKFDFPGVLTLLDEFGIEIL